MSHFFLLHLGFHSALFRSVSSIFQGLLSLCLRKTCQLLLDCNKIAHLYPGQKNYDFLYNMIARETESLCKKTVNASSVATQLRTSPLVMVQELRHAKNWKHFLNVDKLAVKWKFMNLLDFASQSSMLLIQKKPLKSSLFLIPTKDKVMTKLLIR